MQKDDHISSLNVAMCDRRSILSSALGASFLLHGSALAGPTGTDSARGATGRVDVHSHFLPGFYRDALADVGLERPDGIAALPAWSAAGMIAAMDALEIERAYLSISSPGIHFGDDVSARKLARRVNEEAARLKTKYPGRIEFFASTPLPDRDGAVAEITYALDELGASGIVFESNFGGMYLGNSELEPIYAEINRRNGALFIHPTSPRASCACGHDGHGSGGLRYPAPMLEFIFDTTRTISDMVITGVLDRHPAMKVIVPHAGAALSILAGRIDLVGPMLSKPDAPVPPSIRSAMSRLYFDLAGSPVPEQLAALLSVATSDHLLYGSDWPFTPTTTCITLARALDNTPLLRGGLHAKIMRANAKRLFDSNTD